LYHVCSSHLGFDDTTRKGHSHDTVIYNQEMSKVVSILSKRRKEDVIFYDWPKEVRSGIEVVSIDMSRSYCYFVLKYLPDSKSVPYITHSIFINV